MSLITAERGGQKCVDDGEGILGGVHSSTQADHIRIVVLTRQGGGALAGVAHQLATLTGQGLDAADPFSRLAGMVGDLAEAGPDLLAVDAPRVALEHGTGGEAREVAAGVGLAHADAPGGGAADDVGQELGLLVGPRGSTLQAVQDLARVASQRRLGDHDTRLRVDIGGYRQRRKDALGRFATKVANDVIESGTPRILEPMNSADRKIVHDTLSDFDGISTRSEGEDQQRRVVIAPAGGAAA